MTDKPYACARCGRSMPSTARRCIYCGAVKGRQCQKCKAVCPPGASVCLFCGAEIPATVPNYVSEAPESDTQSRAETAGITESGMPAERKVTAKSPMRMAWVAAGVLLVVLALVGAWVIRHRSDGIPEATDSASLPQKPSGDRIGDVPKIADRTPDRERPSGDKTRDDAQPPEVSRKIAHETTGTANIMRLNGKVTHLENGRCRIEYEFDSPTEGRDWGANGRSIVVRDGAMIIQGRGRAVGAKLKVPIGGNFTVTASYRMVSSRGECGVLLFSANGTGDRVGYVVAKEGQFRAYKKRSPVGGSKYAQKRVVTGVGGVRLFNIRWDRLRAHAAYTVGGVRTALTHQRDETVPQFVGFYLWAFPEGSTVAVNRIVVEGVVDVE